jgi:nucleoside-diphosphate-sugar epimerase
MQPHRQHGSGFEFIKCDLSAPGSALGAETLYGADVVVHLAAARGDWAISKAEYWRDNVTATTRLLAAPWAPQVPMWVCMSSVSVYGPADTPLTEEAPCHPVGPYGESKLASERAFREFISAHALRGCAIRPSAVFSPGHPPNTNVYKLIESLRGFPLPLIGGGRNHKTLTYLPNLLDLIDWSVERMRSGHLQYATYNYVEEPVQTVAELISALRDAGVQPARTIAVPLMLALVGSYPVFALAKLIGIDLRITPERVRKFVANTWHDASRVRREGFVPRIQLGDALKQTVRSHLHDHGTRT